MCAILLSRFLSIPGGQPCRSFRLNVPSSKTTNISSSALTAIKKYLLAWDDKEWSSVKDWIRAAPFAVRKSHPSHDLVPLPPTLKV